MPAAACAGVWTNTDWSTNGKIGRMTDVVQQHIEHLTRARYSASTLRERERVLRTLPGDPLALTRETTQAWWEGRQNLPNGEPRSAASLSQEASHVRRFYRWAMQQGLTERNAADWLPDIRQKRPAATPVPEGDLYRLMQDAPDDIRRAVALAAMAGLRSAEIAAIQWTDLDPGNGVLWVREGKGSKGRSVPLSAGLMAELGSGDGFEVCDSETGATCRAVASARLTYRTRQLAAYLQDDWRPLPGLVVTAGARWEQTQLGGAVRLRDQVAPRLGMAWDPADRGRVRVAHGDAGVAKDLRPDAAGLFGGIGVADHDLGHPGLDQRVGAGRLLAGV